MSNKKIVEKVLYGQNETDFNASLLPKSRKEQFKYILKNNWIKLFTMNMVMFLFFIPVIIYYFMSTQNYKALIQDMKVEEIVASLFAMNLFRYLIVSLLMMIGFMGLAGGSFVIRKMVFDEVVNVQSDFIKGIKNSYKQFMIFGFLFGMMIYVLDNSFQYVFLTTNILPFAKVLLLMTITLVFIVLTIAFMYMLNLSNLYVMKTSNIITSSMLLVFKKLFINIGICLIAFIPIFVWLVIPDFLINLITISLLFVFGFSYILLLFVLLSMNSFDEYINKKQYPEFVRKGLSNNE